MKTRLKSASFSFVLAFAVFTGINARLGTSLSRFTVEQEPELKIEEWMVQDDYWAGNSAVVAPEADEVLELEPWMTENCYWE